MSLGQALLHYQIEASIGSGGMGDVFRARDTKLGRSVAVKMLPDAFAQDPERVSRFAREARLLAGLNHPNIATLHGLEQADGRHFLVMELVEGDTLSDRIARGSIPVSEALAIAHQITEALEAAHEKGVIHRDLKPANVKITPQDRVKVLDFGLAKALEAAPADLNTMNSPTMSRMATIAGVILGTAGYMSPEQAKGRDADQRSDIFSFGCVLYEMLTGRRAFDGETVTEVIASVLKQDADLSIVPSTVHPRVVELVRRCLAKDPKRRWHAIGDVRVEIETILAESQGLGPAHLVGLDRPPLWKRLGPLAATAVLVAAVTGATVWNLRPSPPAPLARFPFVLPEGQSITRGGAHTVAISPDGQAIVYVANRQLYLRKLSDVEASPIEGPALDVANPFFSPDGLWVGFYSVAEQRFKKVALTGGAPVSIGDAALPYGATWTIDNEIVFADPQKGIVRMSANGGTPEVLIGSKQGELMQGPQVLPDGDHILFSVMTAAGPERDVRAWDKAKIVVQSLRSGARTLVLDGGADARYLATGHLFYAVGSTAFAVPFDLSSLSVSSGPVPVIEAVQRTAPAGAAHVTIANNGTMVYLVENFAGLFPRAKLVLVDRNGVQKPLPLAAARYSEPRISPDGTQAVVQASQDIWVYELSGASAMRRLTFASANYPLWTHDSKRVIYRSDAGVSGIFWQRADGVGAAEELAKQQGGPEAPNSISRDGKTLAFRGRGGIWTLALDGDRTPTSFTSSIRDSEHAAFSPDGRWIAYSASERREIYVESFPPGAKYQITANGGMSPLWAPDGRQIFYLEDVAGSGQLMSVDVRTEPSVSFSTPTRMPIQGIALGANIVRPYDITPDGKQFLVLLRPSEETEKPPQAQLRVTLNWLQDLAQRVR